MDQVRPPPYFHLKKYALMGFTIAQIVLVIIGIVFSGIALGAHKNDSVTQTAAIYLIVVFVIAALIQILGLMGAWKENFCLSCTYAVLSALSTISSIYEAIRTPSYWFSTAFGLLVTITAILFTIDLRRMRRVQQTAVY